MTLAPVIAIDGPTASGKGTVASLVAEKLGFHYLDSGALYRLVALASEKEGVDVKNGPELGFLVPKLLISFEKGQILLNGEDATESIRTEAIGLRASASSSSRGKTCFSGPPAWISQGSGPRS